MQKTVLFVDDDADVRKTAQLLLKKAGYGFHGAAGPEEAFSRLVSDPVDVILLDLNFARAQTSGEEGLACLRDILRHDPQAAVVVVTGHSGLNIAVQALRNGARDFIMKPWNNDRLIQAIESASTARKPDSTPMADPSILIGRSEAIVRIKATIDRCAALTAAVLIRGEVGTGKTLAATSLHRQSGRANLVQVEAHTVTQFDDTPNTTLVLDNIERLPEEMAPSLMAWLNLASRRNSRLVVTSSKPVREMGLDRGLTYAISTLEVEMPPLRERGDDIVQLAEHFLRVTCQNHGFGSKTLSPEAEALLMAHPWTDNVHALRHLIERAVILSDGSVISAGDLPLDYGEAVPAPSAPRLAQSEKAIIEDALKRHNFNVSAAATDLGLTRPALYRRMSKHGL